jgi:DNA-binding NarL/FixJ family response regulator
LTTRQCEVLRLVAAGNTDKQIARRLRLSPRTVEMHVGNALRALGCRTRAEATHRAAAQRLL